MYSYVIYQQRVDSENRRYYAYQPQVSMEMILDKNDLTIDEKERSAREFVKFLEDQSIPYYIHWETENQYNSSMFHSSFWLTTTYSVSVFDLNDATTIKMFRGVDPTIIEEPTVESIGSNDAK